MVRWLRWHCPPDTGFEIRALAVCGRARYLSITEAPHNTDFHTWMGKKHFCFFETAETGNRTPNSGVQGSGANHYPGAPALECQIRDKHVYYAWNNLWMTNCCYFDHKNWSTPSSKLHRYISTGIRSITKISNAFQRILMATWSDLDMDLSLIASQRIKAYM